MHVQGSYSVVVLAVAALAVSMVILEEDSLVGKVAGKGDGGYSETWESALEAVPAREWAGISPGLTVTRGLDGGLTG